MKKYFLLMLLCGQLAWAPKTYSQNIAINATGSLPDTSAMLDVSSANKGLLAPRMSTAQQNAIPLPATGLLVFNTTTTTFNVNVGTPAAPVWTALLTNAGPTWSTIGNTGTTPGANFIGTTDANDFVFKTNNTEAMRLTSAGGLLGINVTNPTYRMQVEDPAGANADIAARIYNNNDITGMPSMQLQVAAGTKAAPQPVISGTPLGVFHFTGYDGSAFNDYYSAGIVAKTTQNWSTSAHGTYMAFKTIANNTTTDVERIRIDQNGNVGIATSTPNSTLQINGSLATPVVKVSSAYTLNISNSLVLVTTGSSNVTITLPPVASCPGRIYTIKKIDKSGSGQPIIDGNGTEQIDGSSTYSGIGLGTRDAVTLQSDGTQWNVISVY